MRLSDFRYDLPEELIAQFPTGERAASRLLHLGADGDIVDRRFLDLPDLVEPGDLLVFNDTRVLRARLFGRKDTGGRVEILIERLLSPALALAQVKASKSPKAGTRLRVAETDIEVTGREGDMFRLTLIAGEWEALMRDSGHLPLPPYIRRDDGRLDEERYQTVYGERPGAVAAPTAGLHFDQAMLGRLEQRGVESARVTLHVGAGTFQPVRVENLSEHRMHAEWLQVGPEAVEAVQRTKARGGRVVAVGTTSVRALESAAAEGVLTAATGDTRLFITPGYKFRVVDSLLTNFHLPESTLLMLVCAFAGYERILNAYRHAVDQRYRFFSYGDAMLLEKTTN